LNALAFKVSRRLVADEAQCRRRLARSKRVRNAIMATAVPLSTDHGSDAITVEEIATASGISRRTIFRYFPAKADNVQDWPWRSAGECSGDGLRRRPAGHSHDG